MEINYSNIPKALLYFVFGTFLIIFFYYIFSPSQTDLIGILTTIGTDMGFTGSTTLSYIIYFGIMAVSILITLVYPAWMIISKEEAA